MVVQALKDYSDLQDYVSRLRAVHHRYQKIKVISGVNNGYVLVVPEGK